MRRVVVLAALCALAAPEARAYLCTRSPDGPSLAWPARTIDLVRARDTGTLDDVEVDRVMARSAQAWTDVSCSDLVFRLGEPTGERRAGFDWAEGSSSPENENLLVFRGSDPGDPTDLWLHSFQALAITTVTFVASSGRILDADVEFNEATFPFTTCDPGPGCATRFDLENTLTHELGHVLGLDHPPPTDPGAEEATMFASAPEGDTAKRTLEQDDVAGLCFLYPSAEPAGECYGVAPRPPPPVTFEPAVCAAGGRAAPLVALLALLGLAGAGRRRPVPCRRRA